MPEAVKPVEPQDNEPDVDEDDDEVDETGRGLVHTTTDLLDNTHVRDAEITLSNALVGTQVRQIQKWLAVGMYDVREGEWPGRGEVKERIKGELLVDDAQAERLLQLSVFDLGEGMDDEKRMRKLAILQREALVSQLMLAMNTSTVEMTYKFEDNPLGPEYPQVQKPMKAKITGSQNGQPYINPVIAGLVSNLLRDIADLKGLNDKKGDASALSLERVKMMIMQHTEKKGEQGSTRTSISITKKTKKTSKKDRLIEESRAAEEIRKRFLSDAHTKQIESHVIEMPENDPSKPQ